MKPIPHLLSFFAIVFCCCLARADQPDVTSVTTLDINRYVGKWYEIAAFPMFFQRNCIGDTTAEYSLDTKGEIDVTNRCRTKDGFDQAKGKTWQASPISTSQLKVSFFWPFRADYWVIGLDEDYQWAVVANPNRKYLWILSRTPDLNKTELERAMAVAKTQGYDLKQLKFTKHGSAVNKE
ncbi:lipocalin family protein [Methyloradius palustris]|nr:lipocalin family protein [Methyloradius palustris]